MITPALACQLKASNAAVEALFKIISILLRTNQNSFDTIGQKVRGI